MTGVQTCALPIYLGEIGPDVVEVDGLGRAAGGDRDLALLDEQQRVALVDGVTRLGPIRRTTPLAAALMTCSIFMDSMTSTAWPAATSSPTATEIDTIVPCSGAGRATVPSGPAWVIAAAGAAVEPTALGFPPERVWDAWLVWRRWLAGNRIVGFLQADPANRTLIKPEALWEYDQGQGVTASQFMAASVQRSAFYQGMLNMFGQFDVLALPSAQVWPFDKTWRWPQAIVTANGTVQMDTYHRWMEVVIYATLAGLPSISVPTG